MANHSKVTTQKNYAVSALILAIKAYRYIASSLFGHCCRFQPSCSLYAIDALQQHGLWRGIKLTLQRLSRCQPWFPGGKDAVPK